MDKKSPNLDTLDQGLLNLATFYGMKIKPKNESLLMKVLAVFYAIATFDIDGANIFMSRFSTHFGNTLYVSEGIQTNKDWQKLIAHELQHVYDRSKYGWFRYVWMYCTPELHAIWPLLVGTAVSIYLFLSVSWIWGVSSILIALCCSVVLFMILIKTPSKGRTLIEMNGYKITLWVMVKQGYRGSIPYYMEDLFKDSSYLWMAHEHDPKPKIELKAWLDSAKAGSDLSEQMPLIKDLERLI